MPVFLHGLALQFYRGIGSEMQYIAPFGEMNIFVGANNAGKSTVLNFIAGHLTSRDSAGRYDPKITPVEAYRGQRSGNLTFAFGVPTDKVTNAATKALEEKNLHPVDQRYYAKTAAQMVRASAVNRLIWLSAISTHGTD